LGYLDELEKEYDDPIAYFTNIAKQMDSECLEKKQITFTIDADNKIDQNFQKNISLTPLYKWD